MQLKKSAMWLAIMLFTLAVLTGCTTTDGRDPISDALRPIFFNFPNMIGAQGEMAIIYLRFAMFCGVFALFYFGLSKTKILQDDAYGGGKNKKAGIVIAIVLALLSTIAIPDAMLRGIVEVYSGVMGIVAALLPVVIGLYLNHNYFKEETKFSHLMRAFIYVLIAYVLGLLMFSMESATIAAGTRWPPATYFYNNVTAWLPLGIVMVVIAAVLNFLNIFGGMGGALGGAVSSGVSAESGGGRSLWDRVTGRGAATEAPAARTGGEAGESAAETAARRAEVTEAKKAEKLASTETGKLQALQKRIDALNTKFT